MDTDNTTTLYVRALSGGEWFGGWAPVQGRLEWLHPEVEAALFTLLYSDVDEADEYEFYQPGTLVLAVREEGDWRGQVGHLLYT